MLNANTLQAEKSKRAAQIKIKRALPDAKMVDGLIDGYKFLSAAGKQGLAQRIAQFHDNTQTPNPFGGA